MQKIVINRCFGGFGLSHKAFLRYAELAKINLVPFKTSYGYNYYIDGIEDNDHFFLPHHFVDINKMVILIFGE